MDLTDLLRRSLPAPPLMTLLAALPLHAAPPLRFLVVDGHGMPLAQARAASGGQRGAALGPGIIKEWQDALAAELGARRSAWSCRASGRTRPWPGARWICAASSARSWPSADAAADYDWPPPFMDVEERVVGNAGAAPVHTMADLDGKRIGTVHGYQYRKLAPLSDAGRARRDDAPSGAALLAKQLAGRTDVSVMRTLDFHYLQRRDPRLARLALAPLVISRFSLYCARTRYSSVTLDQLQLAQQRLLQAGIPDKILQSYR